VDPHRGQPVVEAGLPLGAAPVAVIMVHGRNAAPANILDLVPRIARPSVTYLAPAAADRTWYPNSFMSDIASNEPGLSSGLGVLRALMEKVRRTGIPQARIVLLGFSQGACLASEFAVRYAARFGGLAALSGGLVGPPGTRWDWPGGFDRMPAFFGCSDRDAHVPRARVAESAAVFARMGADVTERIYPDMGHRVIDDEIAWLQRLLDDVSGQGR
jgi:phospholipase/carboxylesterase